MRATLLSVSLSAALAALALAIPLALAQNDTTPVFADKLREQAPKRYTLNNARIWLAPGEVIERGSIHIDQGRIVDFGSHVRPLAGATVIDLQGKTVLPAFLELISNYGVDPAGACKDPPQAQPPAGFGGRGAGMPAGTGAASPTASSARHWNRLVCPERDLSASVVIDKDRAAQLRKLGFGAVLSAPDSGVLRGASALLSLEPDSSDAGRVVLKRQIAQHGGIEQAFGFGGVYPGSLMGAYAMLRQALMDARYSAQGGQQVNVSLEALLPLIDGKQALVYAARDELDYERAYRLGQDFKLKLLVDGNGFEYRKLDDLARYSYPLVVPLNFPQAPTVSDPEEALERSLVELEHWRYAPFNPAMLHERKINFALSASNLDKPDEQFLKHLRQAIEYGLPLDVAIDKLTRVPARLIGVERELGSIARGARANLLVADAEWPKAERAKLYEVWVSGSREKLASIDAAELAGNWTADGLGSFEISTKPELKVKAGEFEFKGKQLDRQITLQAPGAWLKQSVEHVQIAAELKDDQLLGRWFDQAGVAQRFVASRSKAEQSDSAKSVDVASADKASSARKPPEPPDALRYPAGEYGFTTTPPQMSVVFRSATVWLAGDAPRPDTDVYIEGGLIKAVGQDLKVPLQTKSIDASGLHLSPGLIDAHSHIAVSGNLNEPSHTVTSEVRIGDVLDPTDIDIYRQLAGGLTTAHVMHGSANTIGGQSQVIKLRWGASAEGLKFAEAAPTIKFALGENPKQANWGDMFRARYPQTRMGVEQLLVDSFTAAQSYRAEKAAAEKAKRPFRRDLRLEALVEILDGKRMPHVHSYRQDEILMYMRLAERFGFKVAAFQHVLEGYKVAPELAKAGAGASSFADWWAFKVEVYDAIPHNNAMLMRAGVVVSSNSDSNDLARRLNTEAAKAIRYGGLTPTEALKLVTINPAKQLRVDDKVGSIEVGKQADVVLWSASPLSTMARVQQTWIDGRKYFDVVDDQKEQARIQSERSKLISLALAESAASGPKAGPGGPPRPPAGTRFVLDFSSGIPSILSAERPLYHNGEPIHLCRGAH